MQNAFSKAMATFSIDWKDKDILLALSGGLDSAVVAALAAAERTATIDKDKQQKKLCSHGVRSWIGKKQNNVHSHSPTPTTASNGCRYRKRK